MKTKMTAVRQQLQANREQKIEGMIGDLEEAIKAENYASMKELTETLKKAVMEVGEKAYSTADANNPPPGEDVIETDFSTEK